MSAELLFRADAGPRVGTGHVMRCLALAQAWRSAGGKSVFLTTGVGGLEERLANEDVSVIPLAAPVGREEDARRTAEVAKDRSAAWVVADGYGFGADYQRIVKTCGARLLLMDDYGQADRYCADLVLNQNIDAKEALYERREPQTKLLLGLRYVLLRREFLERDRRRTPPAQVRRVLVSLGGADPANATDAVLQALLRLNRENLEVRVVLGAANPHFEKVSTTARSAPFPVRLDRDVKDMAAAIGEADMAVAAGGVSAWEMAYLGLPAILITLAENQRPVAAGLAKAGVCLSTGPQEEIRIENLAETIRRLLDDPGARQEMSRSGQALVDGEGASRVLMRLRDEDFRLRPARWADAEVLFQWANDPAVRAAAFSPDPIAWEDHRGWFKDRLADSGCRVFLALDGEDRPLGQVSFEGLGKGEAETGVSVARESRGSGLGGRLIGLAAEAVFRSGVFHTLHAFVKPDNIASQRAFESAGFQNKGLNTRKNHPAVHFMKESAGGAAHGR